MSGSTAQRQINKSNRTNQQLALLRHEDGSLVEAVGGVIVGPGLCLGSRARPGDL